MALDEPIPSTIEPHWMQGGEPRPWRWAVERLEAERNYWLVTVRRDGFPQARPVWGIWSDLGLLLSVGHGGLHRTAGGAAMPITVHVDDATDVVIVEGVVDRIAPYVSPEATVPATFEVDRSVLAPLVDRYNAKYSWDLDRDGNGLNFLVRPHVVYGWHSTTEVVGGSKWVFPRPS